eukprot:383196_1
MSISFIIGIIIAITNSQQWPPTPCDPLVVDFCTLPWPNDYWLLKDQNQNPINLNLTEVNLPIDIAGRTVDPTNWNVLDGFSPLPAIMTFFDDLSLENSNVPRLWNIDLSSEENTPVVILEASTGRRIPYWAELDHNSDDLITGYQENRTLMIWPAFRLNDGERYIIGMRGLQNSKNELVGLSPGFAALRDGTNSNDPAIVNRRQYFEDYIFKPLTANGVDRNELQIAWDFSVMSTKQQTTRMINMRDDAFTRIDWKNGGVKYRIFAIQDNYNEYTARRINGMMSVPWYLNNRLPSVNTRIITQWDNTLMPVYQREEEVHFEIVIPHSVANGTKQAKFIQYGHGLFDGIFEIMMGVTQPIWDEWGYVVGGVNWLGMCFEDITTITNIITNNLTNFAAIPDRLHQGMLDALFYQQLLISENFLNDERIWDFDGRNILPQEHQSKYWGISLGGIMGSVFMSLSTNITHGVCNVPGFPFELLLPRSTDFDQFKEILKVRYKNNLDILLVYSMSQLLYNRITPSGYLHHTIRDPLIGTPVHNILIQYGLGDHQVSWLGAQQMGRSLQAVMYNSNVPEYNETLYLQNTSNWIDDNVVINTLDDPGHVMIQGWDFKQPQVPFVNLPPRQGSDVHQWVGQQFDAQDVAYLFYEEGLITNQCKGPCNGKRPMNENNIKYDPRSWHENKYKVQQAAQQFKKQYKH